MTFEKYKAKELLFRIIFHKILILLLSYIIYFRHVKLKTFTVYQRV